MRCSFLIWLLAVTVLAGATGLSARELRGRLFLGKGLELFLQEDESVLTNVLRAVCLVNSEIPVIRISALTVSRDLVYIGTDRRLYHRPRGETTVYCIGDARDLARITVRDAVRFVETRDTLDPFRTAKHRGRLGLRLKSRLPEESERPSRASMGFWLDELQREYDLRTYGRLHRDNVILILNALPESLPVSGNGIPLRFENLKALQRHIRSNGFEYVEPLKALVKILRRRVRQNLCRERQNSASYASDTARLLRLYDSLGKCLEE